MRAVFLDFGTVSNGDLDPGPLVRALPGIVIHDRTPQADVPARIAGFEAILANKSVIDGDRRNTSTPACVVISKPALRKVSAKIASKLSRPAAAISSASFWLMRVRPPVRLTSRSQFLRNATCAGSIARWRR